MNAIAAKKQGIGRRFTQWLISTWELSFINKWYRIALHTGFWLVLLFFGLRESVIVHITVRDPFAVAFSGILLTLYLFYPLVYCIVPLFQKRKWVTVVCLFIIYYIAAVYLRSYHIVRNVSGPNVWVEGQDFWTFVYRNHVRPFKLLEGFISSITGLISIIYIPLTLKFLRYAYKKNARQNQLEKEKTQLELNFLKAQINPHLLFNTLNNLQSFIIHGEKERSVGLLTGLANLLRLSLYEYRDEYVTLSQEIKLLRNYIAVESVRHDEYSQIELDIAETNLSYQLPALLFMPLVENAFKYSYTLERSYVRICLRTVNDQLQLEIFNTCTTQRSASGGIGLANVKKRLEYYFPGRHNFTCTDKGDNYTVNLTIYPAKK
ncbi:sensor histidine kinase [Longitalea luteola]|uniref:sensor histidine kinase n=1 Tax=Longitalea luteola TaxID=2812563 RepID=UPI001A96A53A|nr:histidine kinase [Longitalea luteola]